MKNSRSYVRAFLIASSVAVIAFASACGGESGGSESPDGGTDDDAGVEIDVTAELDTVERAAEAVQGMAPMTLSFPQVLDLLDLDGNEVVDKADRGQLMGCLETDDPDPRCDLTGDGTVDAADALVFKLLVGDTQPRPAEEIALLAGMFRLQLELDEGLSIVEVSAGDDYDEDGDSDADDVRMFANALQSVSERMIDLDG